MERLFAVASSTIVAPAPGAVTIDPAAERAALLEGYERFRSIIDGYAEPARPSLDDVQSVAGVLSAAVSVAVGQNEFDSAGKAWGYGLAEGRSWRLRLAPGVLGMRTFDANRAEQTAERAEQRRQDRAVKLDHTPVYREYLGDGDRYIDHEAEYVFTGVLRRPAVGIGPVQLVLEPQTESRESTREITMFSARSRSRMVETVGSLDFSEWTQSDGALAMVTLTLPGDWETVAPDGRTFKKLLKRFEMRWRRAIGKESWRCLWKLEFQRRGAPHWHGLMRVPALVGAETFEEWLSRTWCEVVDHPDAEERAKHLKAGTGVDFSGKDFSDPRRISQYFLGHSSKTTDGKEYQHIVPEAWQAPGKGPGRFWGNPGLTKAVVEIDLTEADALRAARILRKIKKARDFKVAVLREQGTAKREGRPVPKVHEVTVKRGKSANWRGRSAHRTMNKKLAAAAAAAGQPFVPQKRFRPSSLGAGGYSVGGWVLVNDGLQLGLDLARYFTARR